jgi:phosphoglycerate dehydrogenase-like enzyme
VSDPIKIKLNRTSARLTEDIGQPGARAQLYAAGLSREDLGKPQVGVASTGFDSNLLSTTRTLRVQKIAIIGFGAIGRECAAILKVMGAKVVGIKHSSYDPWLDKNTDAIYHPEYLSKAIEDCDHVVSILPGTKDNENIIDKRVFSSMKNGSFFYSIGRGNSCDEMTLIWALKNGIIAGAGLDVFAEEPLPANSELWNLSNVLITPHSSAICSEYMDLYASELNVKLKPFLEQFTRKLSESDKTCF